MKKNLAIGLIVLLFACQNREDDHHGLKIFRYNEAAGISSLDPAFARDQANIWAVNQLYNSLVQFDDRLEVAPCIAKSWTIDDSALTYTFLLRDDVYFHPDPCFTKMNRRLTANDAEYSLKRLANPSTASPGRWVLNSVALLPDSSLNIRAANDSVLIIRLKEPFAPFLSMLAMQYCAVVPREAVDYYGKDFRRHPVGTGPFVFKRWEEGVKLVLRKNEGYFETDGEGRRLPFLDAVSITFIAEKHTAFMEFILGNYDFISGIDPNYKDVLLNKNGDLKDEFQSTLRMEKGAYLNTEYLGFQFDFNINPVLKDVRIRRAINIGFDRKAMMKYLRNNLGIPGESGFVPPALSLNPADSAKKTMYDPQLAAQYLREAGFPGGKGLPEIKLYTTSGYLDLCEFIQSQLALLGIKLSLELTPPASLRDMMFRSKAPFFRGSWIADYPDAENYYSLLYSENKVPNGPNYTGFNNNDFDRFYRAYNKAVVNEDKVFYAMKMDSVVKAEVPVVVLYYDIAARFIRKEVKGLKSNPLNLLVLKTVDKKPD